MPTSPERYSYSETLLWEGEPRTTAPASTYTLSQSYENFTHLKITYPALGTFIRESWSTAGDWAWTNEKSILISCSNLANIQLALACVTVYSVPASTSIGDGTFSVEAPSDIGTSSLKILSPTSISGGTVRPTVKVYGVNLIPIN